MPSKPSAVEVWVVEEFGYGHWLWKPGLTGPDLKAWMRGVDPTDGSRNRLLFLEIPGSKTPITLDAFTEGTEGGGVWHAHLHVLDDSWLEDPTGHRVCPLLDPDARGRMHAEEREALDALWQAVAGAPDLQAIDALLTDARRQGRHRLPGPPEGCLQLAAAELGAGLGEVLAGHWLIGDLHTLDLRHNGLTDSDLEALLAPSWSLPVEAVLLDDPGLTDAGYAALCSGLPKLRVLDLGGAALGPRTVDALSRRSAPFWLDATVTDEQLAQLGPGVALATRRLRPKR